ncbi:MAG: hypothetical protein JWP89_6338 [Schlesneria sp.]|nr:hypothetical protein [Schlesneria sp.]
MTGVELTHRSAPPNEKRPHALTADLKRSTGVAVGYGPQSSSYPLRHQRYATLACAELEEVADF